MNLEEQKFEDREGSDFEKGEGSNLQKIVDRKEMLQKKKLGIKPTDTDIDIANAVSRDVLGKVLSEEMPKQEIVGQDNEVEDDEENDEEKEDKTFDHKEEMRIKMMQLLNPRIVKSGELKNYMSREDIKEEIFATLNQLASHKLDLMKTALAIDEGKQENKEKLRNFARQVGTKGAIKGFVPFDMNHSPLRSGRAILRNEPTEKQQRFNLVRGSTLTPEQEAEKETARLQRRLERGEINPDEAAAAAAEELRQGHYSLHEEVEQLDEANRNPNIMRQGRTKVVKARIRGGKVQRRKRLSAVKGYTIRGGKLKRMSMQERLRRKRAQRRAKVKRRAKMARALMKRKRSMRRRASLGLKE